MEQSPEYPCRHCGYDPALDLPLPYFLRPGAILNGKYVIGKALGQGGFGITYIAWNLALDTKVAIKEYFPAGQVMRDSGSNRDLYWYSTPQATWARSEGLEKFLKEARKMSKVSHISQVARVQDLFQENGTAYIVMDFVAGKTLKAQLEASGTLNWNQAQKIFLPAIQAMEQVHQFGLVHRDISPDNLMLQPDGQVKILDLGAAKDLTTNSGASSMQVAKTGFSPLEQYQVGGSGTWTDVYAMAATIYYSLTGVVPPAATDRLQSDPIRWDLPGFQALPQPVRTALVRALAVQAKDRTQTMGDFLSQLSVMETKQERPPKPQQTQNQEQKNNQDTGRPQDTGRQSDAGSAHGNPKNKLLLPLLGVVAVWGLILLVFLLSRGGDSQKDPQLRVPDESTAATTDELFHVHDWVPATCTAPMTCSTCGETLGTAGDHQWLDATCTAPETCFTCGKTQGSALGHDWKPATNDAPKTCSRCGETEGDPLAHIASTEDDPLGYIEFVDGDFASFYWQNSSTSKYVFDEPIRGCTEFVLYFQPTFNHNTHVSRWKLMIQDTSGNWNQQISFDLNESEYLHAFSFNPKLNIQAVAVIPQVSGSYSYSFSLGIFDAYYE